MKRILIFLAAVAGAGFVGCAGPSGDAGEPMATAVRRAPWNSPDSSGSQLITQHYSIYTTATNEALVRCLPGFMEAAYRNYLRLTNLPEQSDGQPMAIYMMASRQEWASLTESVVGKEAAGPYLSLQAGGYCHKGVCVFWDIGVMGTFSVAGHEGMHQFIYRRLRDRLPMWLEEGLCTVAEGYQVSADSVAFTPERNTIRFADLRTAIVQSRWIPLRKLLSMDSSDAVTGGTERAVGYYGQLWALIQFIRSQPTYRAGMERMLTDAEAGRFGQVLAGAGLSRLSGSGRAYNQTVSEPLFSHYVAGDLEGFEKEFRAFATKLARL